MNDLPHRDNQILETAEGWLELGSWREAMAELAGNKDLPHSAVEDPDLKPLWDQIRGLR